MEIFQELNAERNQRIVVETEKMDWEKSEADGVLRRRLEHIEGDPEIVTTVVRYMPGSSFSPHRHVNGEEIFVLEGTFSDNHGHYDAGSYLRNPAGTSHAPYSQEGCTIFVKLQQFQANDRQHVNIQTREQPWLPGLVEGLSVMPLHEYQDEHVALVKWEPNTMFHAHTHFSGEEIFVLEGVFEDEFGKYPQGTWLRNPHNSQQYAVYKRRLFDTSKSWALDRIKHKLLQSSRSASRAKNSLAFMNCRVVRGSVRRST